MREDLADGGTQWRRVLAAELERHRGRDLYRRRVLLEGPQRPEARIDGSLRLSFCSNDYLGLAAHPSVTEALTRSARESGVGSGASHLVTGHHRAHQALEEALAAFCGRERALLFSTGYMTNLGTISALVQRHDAVFADRLVHASLLDGALLSRAKLYRYPHADPDALDAQLRVNPARRKLVITDGVFSMDGDMAPLPELARICARHGAWLMVDDAHGLGVLGDSGRGCVEHFGLASEAVPVLVGTLGKAFGTFGAFVAGDAVLVETLVQKARPYIYTTALPPAVAEATRAALEIVASERWRRGHLESLVSRFRQGAADLGLPLVNSPTPIQPLILGAAGAAVKASQSLEEKGIHVTAIRPPTVPKGQARLRVTFSAAHTHAQVDRLLIALGQTVATTANHGARR